MVFGIKYVVGNPSIEDNSASGSSGATRALAGGRPQVFRVVEAQEPGDTTRYYHHHISCQPEFVRYSPEELRCAAYGIWVAVDLDLPLPWSQSTITRADEQTQQPTIPDSEALASISADPLHMHHSTEEIRWAHLHTKQDLPSAQLFAFKPPLPPSKIDGALWRANLYSLSSLVGVQQQQQQRGQELSATRRFWEM